MTRVTYVHDPDSPTGEMIDKRELRARSTQFAGAQIIRDDMGADLEHHGYADGRTTASKSVYRRWTKEAGLVEKGNDRERQRPAATPDLRGDVAQAIQMVKQGYRPRLLNIRGD